MNRKTVALAAIIVSALLTGCNKPKTSEEAVTARIDSRYAALIAQDYKKTYNYYTPGIRNKYDYQAMLPRLARVKHVSARVLEVNCASPDTCNAEVEIVRDWEGKPVSARGPKLNKQTVVNPEKWLKSDGEWYFYVE